jgi:fatty-acyl-CoA synthase
MADRPNIFERDLDPRSANHVALTPLSFLRRTAAVYPDKAAVIHDRSYSYRELAERVRRLAAALAGRGIGEGDSVAVLAANTPALLEAHYAVPLLGAVLNALNIRLDGANIAFILEHCEAKVLITDREFADTVKSALAQLKTPLLVIDIDDPLTEAQGGHRGERLGALDYEALLAEGDPEFPWRHPADEWQALAVNYTSGTTGDPKGVIYHHRGAYLNALGNLMTLGLHRDAVYLWTLPMFHCNGWTYTWAVTAAAGTHLCLRRAAPALIFEMIARHGLTHMCGAPIVLNLLTQTPAEERRALPHEVVMATGGTAPPSAVIESLEALGFKVVHLYGLTESFGPATVCAWQNDWDRLDQSARAGKMARQGVNYLTQEKVAVIDPDSMTEVPADGRTLGELMLRGNTVMKGYLKNPRATKAALAGGWFHTGDLGVVHPDGYIEVKDRSKDVIISGGENISSLEIEEVLYRHDKVLEAAVVAAPDATWGESPLAFVTLKNGQAATAEEIVAHCRDNMAHFKAPRSVVFGPLPKTSTGKIQKFVLRARARQEAGL